MRSCDPFLKDVVENHEQSRQLRLVSVIDNTHTCMYTCTHVHTCILSSCMCTHVHVGFILGNVLHRHRPTKELQTGPSTRRGRHVPLRGRCVSCYALAPVPTTGSTRKTKMQDGRSIPNVTYAYDICRVLLCENCFWNVYDHRQGGKPCDMIVVR